MSSESTFYHDLSGHPSDSEALGDRSALWPTLEQMGPAQPSPQQPFLYQPGSHPAGGSVGQMGVPVPLYSVAGTSGSLAAVVTPGGGTWEETQQMHPPPGKSYQEGWKPGGGGGRFEGRKEKREVGSEPISPEWWVRGPTEGLLFSSPGAGTLHAPEGHCSLPLWSASPLGKHNKANNSYCPSSQCRVPRREEGE